MPTLDVNDAFDPSFRDDIVVVRRDTTVDQYGRSQTTETPMSTWAVVVAASPDNLDRLPDYEMMSKSIDVYSPFRFQGPSVDEIGTVTHPDHILWHGSVYVVRLLDDYSGYGRGFTHVTCTSIRNADLPPMPATVGTA